MTDRAELIARIRQVLPTRPSWTLAEYEQAVIAALEAKPEPAKPLPESVEEWINKYRRAVTFPTLIPIEDAQQFMGTIIAAHQAELAKRDAEIAALKAGMVGDYDLDAWLDWRMDRFNTKIAEAKAEGRREALLEVPVLVLSEVSGFLSGIESLTQKGNKPYAAAVRAQVDAIRKLIESARSAQDKP